MWMRPITAVGQKRHSTGDRNRAIVSEMSNIPNFSALPGYPPFQRYTVYKNCQENFKSFGGQYGL